MLGVGWVEEKREVGVVVAGAFGVRACAWAIQPGCCVCVPEGSWECHVYLFESAVGDAVDGLDVSRG